MERKEAPRADPAQLVRFGHKIVRGDPYRKSRLHTERGERVALNPADALIAIATTAARRFGYYPPLPLWSADARRFLDGCVRGARVFEWGSGMSTIWLARRARQVVSVEDDHSWFERLSPRLAGYPHVSQVFAISRDDYVSALEEPFDVVIVDGSWRQDCLRRASEWLGDGAIVVLDDTDKGDDYRDLDPIAKSCFPAAQRYRFSGFTHGCVVPHETTVLRVQQESVC